jgi:hypothetical protein
MKMAMARRKRAVGCMLKPKDMLGSTILQSADKAFWRDE